MAENKTASGWIAAAWIVVSLPLAWGVYNTALGAAKLFTPTPAASVPVPARTP